MAAGFTSSTTRAAPACPRLPRSGLPQRLANPRSKRRDRLGILVRRQINEIVAEAFHPKLGTERSNERPALELVGDQRDAEQRHAVPGDRGLDRLTLVGEDQLGLGSQLRQPGGVEPPIPRGVLAAPFPPLEMNHRVLREIARVTQAETRAAYRSIRVLEERLGRVACVISAAVTDCGVGDSRA